MNGIMKEVVKAAPIYVNGVCAQSDKNGAYHIGTKVECKCSNGHANIVFGSNRIIENDDANLVYQPKCPMCGKIANTSAVFVEQPR